MIPCVIGMRRSSMPGTSKSRLWCAVRWPCGSSAIRSRRWRATREALAMARWLEHTATLAHALSHSCLLHELLGDQRAPASTPTRSRSLCVEQRLHFPFGWRRRRSFAGWHRVARSRLDEGLERIARGLRDYQATGGRQLLPLWLALLAKSTLRRNAAPRRWSCWREALEWIDRTGQGWILAELHRLRGNALSASIPASRPTPRRHFVRRSPLPESRPPGCGSCGLRMTSRHCSGPSSGEHRDGTELARPNLWLVQRGSRHARSQDGQSGARRPGLIEALRLGRSSMDATLNCCLPVRDYGERTMADVTWPRKIRELHSHHFDSTIWNDFRFRDDDIIIATYAKSGTTWVQQIVAQLLFAGAEDLPVAEMSPWLDLRVPPKEVKLPAVEAQRHRRFLKTHLPVDALVFSPMAKYIYIGRDGRDVMWSFYNHHIRANELYYQAVNETPGLVGPPIGPPPASVRQYFLEWLDGDGYPWWSFWDNIKSWWNIRHLPNMLVMHFTELKSDLPGQIRRIASFLESMSTKATGMRSSSIAASTT